MKNAASTPERGRRTRAPEITVLFPTHGRPQRAQALLQCLAEQSLPKERFEVIVVDDGSRPPIRVDIKALPYSCRLVQQPNAGPAAARNVGIALTNSPLVLILNDDAVPRADLLERHVAAHAEVAPSSAVLGTFHFTAAARRSPFTRLLDESDLLFFFSKLEHGATLPWDFFWTCNISIATDALCEVDGFDEQTFDRAICEDVELGARLARRGGNIVYREDCFAEHDHVLTPRNYFDRAFELGRYQLRLGAKSGDPCAFFPKNLVSAQGAHPRLAAIVEEFREGAERALARLEAFEAEYWDRPIPTELAAELKKVVLKDSQFARLSGLYYECTGEDLRARPAPGTDREGCLDAPESIAHA